MSAPNEPGHPGTGGKPEPAGNGPADAGHRSAGRAGRITESGEAPPWQRGGQSRPSAHSAGVDERLRRFVTGSAAPTGAAPQAQQPPQPPQAQQAKPPAQPAKQPAQPAKPSAPSAQQAKPAAKAAPAKPAQSEDAYASELPDLSEPPPRRNPARAPKVSAGPRGPLRASMQIRRIDPWSALKVSLLLSTALFFVWMIAVAILYVALGAMGVWSKLNSNVGDLLTNNSAAELVSAGSIFGGAALIGLVNVVVLTALITLGVIIYNLSTDVVGGVEVTLADRD